MKLIKLILSSKNAEHIEQVTKYMGQINQKLNC